MMRIDMWHAQGQFAQMGILVLFCCSFLYGSRRILVKNIPLGSMVLWFGLMMVYFQYQAILISRYNNSGSFLTFFNFLCVVLFYWVCVQSLNREDIKTILKWFSYSVLVILFFCVLQAFEVSQFFKVFNNILHQQKHPAVVGTIGNNVHLSGYLGICLPLFFGRKLFNILSVILIWIIILFFTNFDGPIAISGVIVGLASSGFYLWKVNKKLLIVLALIGVLIFTMLSFIDKSPNLFSWSGRQTIWSKYFNYSKDTFITGKGLGAVQVYAEKFDTNISKFRHLHNEYLQVLFEAGLIGLLILFWALWDFLRLKINEDKTSITLRAMFFGFMVSCFFNFQGHLWVITVLAMFCYASVYAISNEELLYDSVK